MTATKIVRLCAVGMVGVSPLALTGCGGGAEKQKKIDELTEELASVTEDLSDSRNDGKELEQDVSKAEKALDEVEGQMRDLKRRAETAERELARYKEREERAKVVKERKPSRQEVEDAAKGLVEKQLPALVEINGDKSSGSGVVIESDGKTWVYMAASALAGNSKLEVVQKGGGKLEKFGVFEIADGTDLGRLEIKGDVDIKLTAAEPSELKSGVLVMGVSDQGVLTEGRSYGGDADSLKVSARVMAKSKGSPIFNGETGDLLGVVVDVMGGPRRLFQAAGMAEGRDQQIVTRLDRDIEWSPVAIGTFLGETKVIADADRMTRLIFAFAAVVPSPQGVSFDGSLEGGGSVSALLKENRKIAAVRSLFELDEWLEAKGERASKTDLTRKIEGVFVSMQRISEKDTKAFAAKKFSPYNEKAAAQSLEWREAAEKKLAETLATQG